MGGRRSAARVLRFHRREHRARRRRRPGAGRLLASGYRPRRGGQEIRGTPANWHSGLPAVSMCILSLGVKFGVDSAASQRTCGNYTLQCLAVPRGGGRRRVRA
jgi:hypothetical protein